jgi:hypothetical protein
MNASSTANAGRTTGLGKPITAPRWSDQIPDRLAYFAWILRQHPHIYAKFRALADEYRVRNPGQPFSAELIIAVMRFRSSVRAEGDVFALNATLKPLMARLYLRERPDAKIELRNAWLDHLSHAEWGEILTAWRR